MEPWLIIKDFPEKKNDNFTFFWHSGRLCTLGCAESTVVRWRMSKEEICLL